MAGLRLRERAVQSNLNRRARPTRGHRQSLLRLDVTRGSSCMPRATHAPIPRTILTARVPAIQRTTGRRSVVAVVENRCPSRTRCCTTNRRLSRRRRSLLLADPTTTTLTTTFSPLRSPPSAGNFRSRSRFPPAFRVPFVPVSTLLVTRYSLLGLVPVRDPDRDRDRNRGRDRDRDRSCRRRRR